MMQPEFQSIAVDPGAAEGQRTRDKRTMTTLLLGRVVDDNGHDGLCRIRNLSQSGMMFEARRKFAQGDHVSVELRNGNWLAGTVVWTRDGRNGVSFDQLLTDEALVTLDKIAVSAHGRARAPRFDAYVPTRALVDGRGYPVVIENISQSGAMLRTAESHALSATLILAIPHLGSRLCDRRWVRGDTVGVSFAQVLSYNDLADWLERRAAPGAPN
jgi:hypothetical protein